MRRSRGVRLLAWTLIGMMVLLSVGLVGMMGLLSSVDRLRMEYEVRYVSGTCQLEAFAWINGTAFLSLRPPIKHSYLINSTVLRTEEAFFLLVQSPQVRCYYHHKHPWKYCSVDPMPPPPDRRIPYIPWLAALLIIFLVTLTLTCLTLGYYFASPPIAHVPRLAHV